MADYTFPCIFVASQGWQSDISLKHFFHKNWTKHRIFIAQENFLGFFLSLHLPAISEMVKQNEVEYTLAGVTPTW